MSGWFIENQMLHQTHRAQRSPFHQYLVKNCCNEKINRVLVCVGCAVPPPWLRGLRLSGGRALAAFAGSRGAAKSARFVLGGRLQDEVAGAKKSHSGAVNAK